MLSSSSQPWSDPHARAEALAQVQRRRRPDRRLLGMLAFGIQHDEWLLIEAAVSEALSWPELTPAQILGKATLLYAMTETLAKARYKEIALRVAPLIPYAPGMTQVLVLSTDNPEERYCWRVTPAYALMSGRRPTYLPIEPLIEPYQDGHVTIDHEYLKRVLLPKRRIARPILLLPHTLGLVRFGSKPYVILDGNHRVVCAWHHNRKSVPSYVLSAEEAEAIMVSYTQYPPYQPLQPEE